MTSWKVFSPSRLTWLHKGGAALLASLLTFAGIAASPTAAAFVDSGTTRMSPVTAATVDIAFDDGGREHALELDARALGPGDSVTGTVRVFNSGSVDTGLSMSTPTLVGEDDPSLVDHLHLTVASDGLVLTSGPLPSASFDDGTLTLPAGGSAAEGWVELTITVTLDADAPIEVAGLDADFELPFSSSRSSFRVSGTATSAVSSVSSVTFPIAAVSVGARHTLVVDGQGGVWAWGHNGRGQLGDGSHDDRFAPVRVDISEKVELVSAGVDTSMALTASGRVLTWGNGDVTGDFTGVNQSTPTEVSGPWSRPVVVSTGGYFFLVLDEDGALWSWGNNGDGRLGRTGIGSGNIPTPGRVTTQSLHTAHVSGIHASRYAAMAFTDDGTVVGWGTRLNSATGRTFVGLPSEPVRELALSYDTWLALLHDGRVFTSTGNSDFEPISLTNIITVSSSAAGSNSEKAFIATDGVSVWAWGSNARGQLGLGSGITSVTNPTAVDLSGWGSSPIQSVDLGWQHSVIVSTAGMFSSVGTGFQGELGSGAITFRSSFVGSEAVKAWPGTVPPPATRAPRPFPPSSADAEEHPVPDDDPLDVVVPEPAVPEGEDGPDGEIPGEDDLDPGDDQSAPDAGDETETPTDPDNDGAVGEDAAGALQQLALLVADDPAARDLLVRMLDAARRADEAEAASAADELAHRLDDEGRRLLDMIVVVISAPEGSTDAERMLDGLDRERPSTDAP